MSEAFLQFVKLLEELSLLFQGLTSVEETKLEAVRIGQVTSVEESMNQEQAAILKLRGLDQKRERLASELGYEGLSLREILEKVPEEEKAVLSPVFDDLNRNLLVFKEISGNVEDLLSVSLHEIDKALKGKPKKTFSNKLI